MRVLVTSPDLSVRLGGVANYVRVTLKYSAHQFTSLVRGSRQYDGPSELGPATFFRLAWDAARMASALIFSGSDIVHINTSFDVRALLRDAITVLLARVFRRPAVVFFHGWRDQVEARISPRQLMLFRSCYFNVGAIVVLSQWYANTLRQWGYKGPVFVETTIVDDEILSHSARSLQKGPEFRVLFLSRVGREKGVFEIIEAVAILQRRGRNVRLVVAGDGADLELAKERAMNIAAPVEFAGYVSGPRKATLLTEADAYVLVSDTEGMPTSLVEAMICGVPVVTRTVGGLRDFFDERMGIVVAERNPEEIADALETLIVDEVRRKAVGRFNADYARERFLASRVVARFDHIYACVARPRVG